MAILVTGGAGYIGSHTCIELIEAGYDVVVVDNLYNASEEALKRVEKIVGKEIKFYEADIRDAQVYINDVRQYLDETPLNVEGLNKKLDEAIDYIYTLFNSVNNLVGMADMVENAIVFGNRYRSEYPEIDSELTRAELCFANGQYTKSLKIAISAIEKLREAKICLLSQVQAAKISYLSIRFSI